MDGRTTVATSYAFKSGDKVQDDIVGKAAGAMVPARAL